MGDSWALFSEFWYSLAEISCVASSAFGGKVVELKVVFWAALIGVAAAGSAFAHHGTAGYDMDKVVTVAGTVSTFEWSNPHVIIFVDAKKDGGQVEHWAIEMASPIHMSRFGWSKTSIKAGDQIVAETHPAKNGAPIGTSGTAGGLLKVVVNGQALPMR